MDNRLEQLSKDELLTLIKVIVSGDPDDITVVDLNRDDLGVQARVVVKDAFSLYVGWPDQFVNALLYIDSPTARRDLLQWLAELFFEGAYEADWNERANETVEDLITDLTIWEILDEEVQQLMYELLHEEGDEEEWLTSSCEWKRKLTEKFSNYCS